MIQLPKRDKKTSKKKHANRSRTSRGFQFQPFIAKCTRGFTWIRTHRKRPSKWVLIGVFCGVVLGVAIVAVLRRDDWLTVKSVICIKDQNPCSLEVEQSFQFLIDQPLLGLDYRQLERTLLLNNPQYLSVSIAIFFPRSLEIKILSREPIAVVQDASLYRYLVDNNGKIFAPAQSQDLPLLRINEALAIGADIVHVHSAAALKMLKLLLTSGIRPQEITVYNQNHAEMILQDSTLVLFSLTKPAEVQVDALQYLFNNDTIEEQSQRYSQIDLRFDNPVLR